MIIATKKKLVNMLNTPSDIIKRATQSLTAAKGFGLAGVAVTVEW